ncbi:hypothetical protein L207DRAFT_617375 [Hyaloscypha variabilis F]|uniref:Uncharacterized protein n=1 Tax=Hyaloscypha variabilis (strain UAMH 11265 / GT02V1 / F) TaxID=1149755 RepID=A0A2J6S4E5_HYAVF|nr:hypothetical protein L207DRAFT_617375 [Hyaloscypha variabilis F]
MSNQGADYSAYAGEALGIDFGFGGESCLAYCLFNGQGFFLYETPVSEGFGLVSMLASAEPGTPGILKGAGLSGKLASEVKLRFEIENDGYDNVEHLFKKSGKVKIFFGEGGRSSHLKSGSTHG